MDMLLASVLFVGSLVYYECSTEMGPEEFGGHVKALDSWSNQMSSKLTGKKVPSESLHCNKMMIVFHLTCVWF